MRGRSGELPASVRDAVIRMEAEYREMPGLTLTLSQAQRMLGFDASTCKAALTSLLQRRFLKRDVDGAYLREHPG